MMLIALSINHRFSATYFHLRIALQRSKSRSVVLTSICSARQIKEYRKNNLLFGESPTTSQASYI